MELKDWVKAARKHKGWTLEQLGDAMGRSKATAGFWENGKTAPSFVQVQRIAEVTGYPHPFGREGPPGSPPPPKDATPQLPDGAIPVDPTKSHRIWVVGKGAGGLAERLWDDGDYPVGVTDQYGLVASTDPHAFLVEVSEESMIPKYTPGDFALVEPGTEPELEDDVLVRLSSGQTMIKRLLSQRGAYRFGSYNSTAVLHYRFEDVVWVYYIAHPVPRRKIKNHW